MLNFQEKFPRESFTDPDHYTVMNAVRLKANDEVELDLGGFEFSGRIYSKSIVLLT